MAAAGGRPLPFSFEGLDMRAKRAGRFGVAAFFLAQAALVAGARAGEGVPPPDEPFERVHDLSFLEGVDFADGARGAFPFTSAERDPLDALVIPLGVDAPDAGAAGRMVPAPPDLEAQGVIMIGFAEGPGIAERVQEVASGLDLVDQEGESMDARGSRLVARLKAPDHARLQALVDGLRATFDRRVAVDVHVLVVPAGDPVLGAAEAGGRGAPAGCVPPAEAERLVAAAEQGRGGARLLLGGRLAARVGERARLRSARQVALVQAHEPDLTGVIPVLNPSVGAVAEGVLVDAVVRPAPDGKELTVDVVVLETTVGRVNGVDTPEGRLDLPSLGERRAALRLRQAAGATALIVLGPARHEGAEAGAHVVALVRARSEALAGGGGAGAGPGPGEGAGAGVGFEVADVGALVDGGSSPFEGVDRLVERLREGLGDQGSLGAFGTRALVMGGAPDVRERTKAVLAAERARLPAAVAVDAWLVEAQAEEVRAALDPARRATAGLGASAATAAVERARKGDGARLLGVYRLAGRAGEALAARDRVRQRYLAGVRRLSGGPSGVPATLVDEPVVREAESGVELRVVARGEPGGGLDLEARAVRQAATAGRTASVRLSGGPKIDIALPELDIREAGGRVRLEPGEEWTSFGAHGTAGGEGSVFLVLRAHR